MEVNIHTYNRLKSAYESAVANHKEQFTFEGNELVTQYAFYLLQYLKPMFE